MPTDDLTDERIADLQRIWMTTVGDPTATLVLALLDAAAERNRLQEDVGRLKAALETYDSLALNQRYLSARIGEAERERDEARQWVQRLRRWVAACYTTGTEVKEFDALPWAKD